MNAKPSTADKILEMSRTLFNRKGYEATSLADIASAVGVSKGNLSYHFPTKQDIALRLRDDTRALIQERRAAFVPGDIASDYVAHLLFDMRITWDNRFLLRDGNQFLEQSKGGNPVLSADFDELNTLIHRTYDADMFRQNAVQDLDTLTRSLWIVSRYWMDYLRESEGQAEINWSDQERGIRHHFAVLMPCLKASAQKQFEAALSNAPRP